jgi:alpha-beta hydrolase superfamily lysophospholipase
MQDDWKEFEFLDHPSVTNNIFYPRLDDYRAEDSDHVMSVDLPVERDISISCQLYFKDKTDPTILYFHGNGELASEYGDIGLAFNGIGVSLFVADFRGYGRSGGRPTVTNMLKDAHKVLRGFKRILEERGFAGSHFIMGRSLGSASAIELAEGHPEEFKGVIIESGFCDVSDLMSRLGPGFEQISLRRSPGLERVKKIAIPALVIHGEYDSIVPLVEGKKLYDNVAATDKKLVIIPNADHNSIFAEGMELYLNELGSFIRRLK